MRNKRSLSSGVPRPSLHTRLINSFCVCIKQISEFSVGGRGKREEKGEMRAGGGKRGGGITSKDFVMIASSCSK